MISNIKYGIEFVNIINTYPTVVMVTNAHQRPNGIELKSLSGLAWNIIIITTDVIVDIFVVIANNCFVIYL